jgi:4-carboxymuconolactone decarboxylase
MDRLEAGIEIQELLQGRERARRNRAALDELSPSYGRYSIAAAYGDVFRRDGLDLRQRELITIAILAALGGCEQQLERHVVGAINSGVETEAIVETCVQVAAYAGQARGTNAIRVAGGVFNELGLERP